MIRRLEGALAVAAAFALLAGCGGGDDELNTYANNDLVGITAFTAKSACSCLFVMEQNLEFCEIWVRQSPPVATFQVDFERREVRSSALLFWSASARLVDDDFGCVLE